jgi:hypothetical protein
MDSADLLRRAAAKLRGRAEAAPHGPWNVQYFGDRGYPQRVSNEAAVLVANTYDGPPSPAGSAEFIALLHPPVALALADLCDAIASFAEAIQQQLPEGPGTLMAVVREVLREPEETRDA